jgi:hypothetical protein
MRRTKTPTQPEMPIEERFAHCHPGFQDEIVRIAKVAGLAPLQVFALWRKYSDECSSADQSPVMFEFMQWYTGQLGGNLQALRAAVFPDETTYEAECDAATE